MAAVLALLVVAAVIVVREAVRLALHGRPPQWRGAYQLATPVSPRRRVLAIVCGLVVTYLAVSAIAYAHLTTYGWPTGHAYYAVGELIADGAAQGVLEKGDRIDALDGVRLFVGERPNLIDRIQAKGG